MFFGSLQDHLFGVPNLADFGVQVGSGTPYLEYMDPKMGIKPAFCHKKLVILGIFFGGFQDHLFGVPIWHILGSKLGPEPYIWNTLDLKIGIKPTFCHKE